MDDHVRAIANALSELEGALAKLYEEPQEVQRAAERYWDLFQDPMAMPIVQQVIKNANSEGEAMEHIRVQRFLENAKRQRIPWAVAEERRIHEDLIRATKALFGATPDTIREVFITYQPLLSLDYWIYFTKVADKRSSKHEASTEPNESARSARKELRLMHIQFLEEAHHRDIDYAETRFRKNFEAWGRKQRDEFRRLFNSKGDQ